MPSFVTLLPYVHEPSYWAMRETAHETLLAEALVLDNRKRNLGIAASRNIGALALAEQDADWLVEISPVTRFGPPGGLDFLDHLDKIDTYFGCWVVQSSTPVNWHCIAWHRTAFERVGYFDENFWPVYGEDGDFSRRLHIAAEEDGRVGTWGCVDVDAWITMHGHSSKLAGIEIDQGPLWEYYVAKHGGRPGAETVLRPFGNRKHGLDWWPKPPDVRSIMVA